MLSVEHHLCLLAFALGSNITYQGDVCCSRKENTLVLSLDESTLICG